MDDNLLRLLRQKLVDGIAMPLPVLTRRDTWIPRLAGKVLAWDYKANRAVPVIRY